MEDELKLKWTQQSADFPEYGSYTNSSSATEYTGLYNNTREGQQHPLHGLFLMQAGRVIVCFDIS